MPKVLHIVDDRTPQDCLDQLSLLAGSSDLIASVGRPPEYRSFTLPVQTVHCPLGLGQLGGWTMRELSAQADVIHAWSRKSALAARTLRVLSGKPTVLAWPSLPTRKDLRFLSRLAGRWDLHLIVPTEVAQTALLWTGIEQTSVDVLPPASVEVDASKQARRRREVRGALGISDDQFLLVAPGEMRPGAGHKYASWAHGIVRQIIDDVLLLMPSDGPSRERVRFFAATTGYDDEVFFSEDYGDDLPDGLTRLDALAAADVAAFLGEYDTGLSAIADAMAAGVPIAASNTPDVAECAPNGQAALLSACCDPRGASADILKLIEDRKLAKSLGATGKKRAHQFHSAAQCRERLCEIYAEASRS